MCGICGFTGAPDAPLLEKMTATLIHRGPDSAGYYSDAKVQLGMRRLKILDLDTGDQPIFNEDGTVAVIFNGEIYNFRGLRDELQSRGHVFRTKTDTEVLAHLYEDKGEEFPRFLRGMFAFALWDAKGETLILGRDPLGIKPLYYSLQGKDIFFASELKSLLQNRAMTREMDLHAMDCYLSFLYVPTPLTIFKGARKLEAGSILVCKDGECVRKKYWDLDPMTRCEAARSTTEADFIRMFEDIVREHLVSDVPLGVFLSGGIDSASILAMMRRSVSGGIKTFSIGYDDPRDRSFNELETAGLVARHFKTEHREIIVKPDIVRLLPKMVRHLDEPFADSSALVTCLISEAARKDITVALTGIGGDEAFCGYPRYLGMRLMPGYRALPLFMRRAASSVLADLPESTGSRNLVNWAKRFSRGAFGSELDCYISWISFLGGERRQRLYTPSWQREMSGWESSQLHRDHFARLAGVDPVNRIAMLDMATYLPDDLLMMADRMSMANSLELRVPFCDVRMVEFSAALPSSEKIRGLRLKAFLKDAMRPYLPPEILSKRKRGFQVPLGRWLKDDLRDMTNDLLCESTVKRRGYFSPSAVEAILGEHFSGQADNSDIIWALLNLEVWHNQYMDQTA